MNEALAGARVGRQLARACHLEALNHGLEEEGWTRMQSSAQVRPQGMLQC